MQKINYKSDFDFILRLLDSEGNELPFPQFGWEALLWTSQKVNAYKIWCRDNQCHGCFNDNGQIHVVMDSHGLSPGILNIEFHADLTDSTYPDGSRLVVSPMPLDITLVRESSPCPAAAEVEAAAPYALLTAYDIALREGYTGSKEDYAAALAAMPKAVETAETTAGAYVRDHEALGTLIEKCETLGEDIAEGYRAEKAALDLRVEQWQGDVDRMQPRLSSSETVAVNPDSTLTVTEAAEKALFIKMWNRECLHHFNGQPDSDYRNITLAKYDEKTDEFVVNPGKGDHEVRLTYEEAIDVWQVSHGVMFPYMRSRRARAQLWTEETAGSIQAEAYSYWFIYCRELEVIGNPDMPGKVKANSGQPLMQQMFDCCDKLRHVNLQIDMINGGKENGYGPFRSLPKLETLYLYRLMQSVDIHSSPRLSLKSLRYMVDNCTRTSSSSAIAVTVHSKVYNKLIGDTDDTDVAAMTDDERAKWQKIVTDAATKNLTFAKG